MGLIWLFAKSSTRNIDTTHLSSSLKVKYRVRQEKAAGQLSLAQCLEAEQNS